MTWDDLEIKSPSRAYNEELGVSGHHRDYYENLKYANQMRARVKPVLPPKLRLKMENGQGEKFLILWISYDSPDSSHIGRYATPVNLHRSRDEFIKEVNRIYNDYLRMAQKINKKFGVLSEDSPT